VPSASSQLPVPRISVVLPVRDAAATIARAVASVRAQTRPDWELIAVDDGSTDGTRERLAALARDDARIRVLARPPAGLVAALDAGLAVARGAFVARMDADDESHPGRFAAQATWLEAPENRDVGLVGCLVDFGGDRAANEGYARHVDWLNTLVTPERIASNRFVESPLAHPSVMFRRELVDAFGGYRAGDFPEDYELWLRWLDAGVRMAKVPAALLTWHDSPARLSRTDPRYAPEAFFRMKAAYVARAVRRVAAGRRVLVWGAGRLTRQRAAHLEAHGVTIAGFIDVDPKKTGRGIGGTGRPVLAPAQLPPREDALVLGYVTTRGARDLHRAELTRRGYVEGRDFFLCA